MSTKTEPSTRYDRRVRLVQDTVTQHSNLGDKAAFALAVRIVDVIDHMAETVR
ncbi:hypothetical protein JOF53_008168 [Crossiella equi]|uniref:Uncharacterized protein n=1 Tax=Crossiella equi TaxID=130796 RepID=A0ABS5ARV7_9PSEU|nr:DUF6307 family protein [Crossiella equi]MBP2479296.1 hypothetical protein [Crossiella equi]